MFLKKICQSCNKQFKSWR